MTCNLKCNTVLRKARRLNEGGIKSKPTITSINIFTYSSYINAATITQDTKNNTA
jgi:hypothetical protein